MAEASTTHQSLLRKRNDAGSGGSPLRDSQLLADGIRVLSRLIANSAKRR